MMNKYFGTAVLLFLSSFVTGRLMFLFTREWISQWYFTAACFAVLAGVFTLLCITFGTMCLVISSQRTSEHYSILAALHHFIVKYHRLYVGYKMLRKFRASFENPRKTQEDFLQEIIKRNKDTDYGRQFQLDKINSLEDLRTKHPVTDYNHYEVFANRIAKGEKNVLTTERITRIILTSGTTGKGKLIPQEDFSADKMMIILEALQQEKFPDLNPMQLKMKFHCNAAIDKSECGITVTSAVAIEPHMLSYMVVYSTPKESFMIGNFQEATYVHLLFALRDRNLGSAFVSFSSLFSEVMKFLEANWKKLVEDLATGTVNPALELSPHIRSSLTKSLGSGDPHRAAEIQKECEKGFDGILKRIWPHLKFISTIDNVGLRNRFKESIGKGLEIYSPFYVSSETLIGLNLWPFEQGDAEFALNLTENVFEFIHEDEMDKADAKTLFVDEVELGQNYELIFTQRYGLYRYRIGDVIKVSGFYKNCPNVKFMYRKATLLNMVGEKVNATVILQSLNAALSQWTDSVQMSHYSVAESTLLSDFFREDVKESGKTNLFYAFFLELTSSDGGELPIELQPETIAEEIDKNILERHSVFFRYTNHISQSKVYLVKTGTFHKLQEFILANTSASRAQFKMPLKLRTKEMAKIMFENICR